MPPSRFHQISSQRHCWPTYNPDFSLNAHIPMVWVQLINSVSISPLKSMVNPVKLVGVRPEHRLLALLISLCGDNFPQFASSFVKIDEQGFCNMVVTNPTTEVGEWHYCGRGHSCRVFPSWLWPVKQWSGSWVVVYVGWQWWWLGSGGCGWYWWGGRNGGQRAGGLGTGGTGWKGGSCGQGQDLRWCCGVGGQVEEERGDHKQTRSTQCVLTIIT